VDKKQIYLFITVLALASALALAGMLIVAFTQGGVTAQHFENFFEPQHYADELLRYETGIRAILGIDSLFLVLYTATVVFLALAVRDEKNSTLVGISILALLVATFLDIHENTDLLVFMQMAKENLVPTAEELHSRALWSGVKFQASYLSFFLLAFALPSKTFLEKFLRWSLWLGYVPVGILVYTFPNPLFSWARYVFMLSGLLILSWNFYLRSKKGR
jgi:hypothetical protein